MAAHPTLRGLRPHEIERAHRYAPKTDCGRLIFVGNREAISSRRIHRDNCIQNIGALSGRDLLVGKIFPPSLDGEMAAGINP